MIDLVGARSRNRTGTVFPPRDFKSLASTNVATRAGGLNCLACRVFNETPSKPCNSVLPQLLQEHRECEWRLGSESNRR